MQPPSREEKKNKLRDRRKRHAMAQFDGFDLAAAIPLTITTFATVTAIAVTFQQANLHPKC